MLAVFKFASMAKPVPQSRISDRERRRSRASTVTVAQDRGFEETGVSLNVSSLGATEDRGASTSGASGDTDRSKNPVTSSVAEYQTTGNAKVSCTSTSFPPDIDARPAKPKSNRPILVLAIADAPKPELRNHYPNPNPTAAGSDSDSDSDSDSGLNQPQIPGLPVVLTLSPATPVDEATDNPYLPENYPYGYARDEDGDFEYRPYVDVTHLFGTWNMDEAMLGDSDVHVGFGESDAGVDGGVRPSGGYESESDG
ncbi:hypothetical protein FIBSPDRAFT_878521 [Athelia psychrophila]|uniref:Uncharacterized protein n=1 Tax=Athelia psychrophila TaxID=1759441 RepID=A0A167UYP6_9AGAM|nr:hypothetical protein FIBSPDRAFT_878508 [Fibularhizoctonia sp. CBS 109695]KZP04448.1 hypothetical protein FIBSPDRAFT_878521 [Fibularhizoctonia sp. CBS 109695]